MSTVSGLVTFLSVRTEHRDAQEHEENTLSEGVIGLGIGQV